MNTLQQPVVIQKLKSAFSDWIRIAPHVPKIARYGLGAKIEQLFIIVLDMLYQASFTLTDKKETFIQHAITKLDTLSFFLQIAYKNHLIPQKEYLTLSEKIQEVGRHLGGWRKFIQSKQTK